MLLQFDQCPEKILRVHKGDTCAMDIEMHLTGAEHLHAAFRDYGRRVRKFGKVT